jgi:micrococcal nuclease
MLKTLKILKQMQKNKFIGALSLIMVAVFVFQAFSVKAGTKYSEIYVADVLDGDTIRVDLGGEVKTVKIIGLNAPDRVTTKKAAQCFNLQAYKQAKKLLLGKKVTLEEDITQGDENKDGQLLRHVYLTGGISFAKLMIRDGYGRALNPKKPYFNQKTYLKSEKEAILAKRGLWAVNTCNGKTKK